MHKGLDCRISKTFYQILILFLSIRGKINFLQLARFSERCESGLRYFFEQSFVLFSFNQVIIKMHIKGKTVIAFESSYIFKSGKKTLGVGYFLSGVAGKSKWGLELSVLAVNRFNKKNSLSFRSYSNYGFTKQ